MAKWWLGGIVFAVLSGCCCSQDKAYYVTGYGRHPGDMGVATYNALDNAQHKRYAGGMLNCAMVEDKIISSKHTEQGYEVVIRYRLVPMRPAWENPPIEPAPSAQK